MRETYTHTWREYRELFESHTKQQVKTGDNSKRGCGGTLDELQLESFHVSTVGSNAGAICWIA
jgi:hypothetical protein